MPLCGTDTQMSYGLRLFNEGLVEHGLIDRARQKGLPLTDIIKNEIKEIDEFLREIPNIHDENIRNIVHGIALQARGIYGMLGPEMVQSGGYRNALKRTDDLVWGMDNEFYAKLEQDPQRMKKLVEWINNYEINKESSKRYIKNKP